MRRQVYVDWIGEAIGWLFMLCLAVLVGIVGFLFLSLVWFAFANAHGDAWWIELGHYRNDVGSLCCGEKDCSIVPSELVETRPDGYYLKALKETVPYAEAQPNPFDGNYWRCAWPTIEDRKCFFAPPGSS